MKLAALLLCPLIVLVAYPAAANDAARGKASGCDSLAGIPLNYDVDFAADIWAPVFNTERGRCANNCHFDANPPNLNDAAIAAITLIDGSVVDGACEASSGDYVKPCNPAGSLLFQKVNCENPDRGNRMPLFGGDLSLEDQALIYDWIAQGARAFDYDGKPLSDVVYRDSLESTR